MLLIAILGVSVPREAVAFCGFYVGKADASLYNQASQVVMVRHQNKTVLSMMNDYKGDLKEFALVVPVPVVLKQQQIHIGERELFARIDAYSAPRLVEYSDQSPCGMPLMSREMAAPMASARMAPPEFGAKSLGVTVEAQYTIGEYDIVILSAEQSDGLEKWLIGNGYRIPAGAARALRPYIKQQMRFFVAKVNLTEQARTGLNYLRPLQFAFESPKFMLPLRLGMINANGPQDLIIYAITQEGRVETTNYRTVKLPTGTELPEYIKGEFSSFYKAMFSRQVKDESLRGVFTEYFWDMSACDPCAASPLSSQELRKLGVFWGSDSPYSTALIGPNSRYPWRTSQPTPVMLTRLHVRYSADTFPEDLVFQETQDTENFQARYVVRHPWPGSSDACPAAASYFQELTLRQQNEAANLADLTGWNLNDIVRKVGLRSAPGQQPWWKGLWD
jgi:hypothetical protein